MTSRQAFSVLPLAYSKLQKENLVSTSRHARQRAAACCVCMARNRPVGSWERHSSTISTKITWGLDCGSLVRASVWCLACCTVDRLFPVRQKNRVWCSTTPDTPSRKAIFLGCVVLSRVLPLSVETPQHLPKVLLGTTYVPISLYVAECCVSTDRAGLLRGPSRVEKLQPRRTRIQTSIPGLTRAAN